ncbi:MAG: Spy/CpxP family protein refolding chaperone [candidate division Zixibacteria bacterium]|nr:Spy/CpxP family protein refolding chaperone [candidate division Zixibacteria bacterium]
MKRVIILATTLFSFVAVGLYAQMPRMACLPDELKLTEAQEKQMKASLLAEQKDLAQLRADLAKAKIEMKEIMMADNVDKAAAMKKFDQVSAAKAAIGKRKLSGRLERMSILTPEQRKQCPMGIMGDGPRGRKADCCKPGCHEGRGPGKGGDFRRMGPPDRDDD